MHDVFHSSQLQPYNSRSPGPDIGPESLPAQPIPLPGQPHVQNPGPAAEQVDDSSDEESPEIFDPLDDFDEDPASPEPQPRASPRPGRRDASASAKQKKSPRSASAPPGPTRSSAKPAKPATGPARPNQNTGPNFDQAPAQQHSSAQSPPGQVLQPQSAREARAARRGQNNVMCGVSDRHDVMLNPLIFHKARKELKFKPSVDLFASAEHHQLPRYYSPVPDPKAAGLDAFKFDWKAEQTPYANPPWPLIPRVLRKIRQDQVRIMVVIPDWPKAPWYPEFESLCEKSILLTDPVFLDSEGKVRPKPWWNTRVAVLNGTGKRPPQKPLSSKADRGSGTRTKPVNRAKPRNPNPPLPQKAFDSRSS